VGAIEAGALKRFVLRHDHMTTMVAPIPRSAEALGHEPRFIAIPAIRTAPRIFQCGSLLGWPF
jgi:hypothetical protein